MVSRSEQVRSGQDYSRVLFQDVYFNLPFKLSV